jgi:hypothetical protein
MEEFIFKYQLLLPQSKTQTHQCDEHPKGGRGNVETHKMNEEMSSFEYLWNFNKLYYWLLQQHLTSLAYNP